MIAEKALLGTFIKENYLIQDSNVRPEHFEVIQHKILFQLMQQLTSKGQAIDVITLTTQSNPEEFGGMSYINDLVSFANPLKTDKYEQLVIDAWKEREKRNILQLANDADWEIQKVIDSLNAINESRNDDHNSISELIASVFEAPWHKREEKSGIPTGIIKLDTMTNGWQDGNLVIIAARPSMGKSDIMLHFAKQAGWHKNLPIIFSLEMPADSLNERLIASTGNYNRAKMRDPYKFLSTEQKDTWTNTLGRVGDTNIQIFDQSGQTVPMMRAKARKMMNQYPDKKPLIIIDYLGLIKSNEFYGGSANLQITEISKNLKGMAKDFRCPVICLAQLNRSVEQRQVKKPMMSDIRDSGSVEQDADLIMFLYREKYYNKESNDNTLELIIAKNRNGPVGTIHTIYNEFTGEIDNA